MIIHGMSEDNDMRYLPVVRKLHFHNACSSTFLWLGLFVLPIWGQATQSPNFVIVLTDDQSWVGTSLKVDPDVPSSKSDYYRTPHIQSIANQGMNFSQGYAPAPYCCPTRRSILIGQSPARHIYQKDQKNWTRLYRKQLSLPQMLKRANPEYQTAHFGKWDMRFDNVTPAEMGYDQSDGYTNNADGGGRGSGGPASNDDPKQVASVTQRACDFIEAQAKSSTPFFVQVSHYAVHLDIYYRQQTLEQVKQWPLGEKHNMPEFAAMTHDVDDAIGVLLNKIKSLGLEESTYIFFLSDNGGRKTIPGQNKSAFRRNDPLRDGKGSVYEGGIRVPFIVRGPKIKPGTVSHVPVSGLDLFPTMADLAGYPETLPKTLDGGSLTDLFAQTGQGTVKRNQPFLIFHQAVARSAESAIIQGEYKLVKTWKNQQLELFHLPNDLGEQRNLVKQQPEKARQLHAHLERYLTSVGAETRKTGSKSDAYKNARNTEPTSKVPSDFSNQKRKPSQRPNVLLLSIDDLNDWVGTLQGHPQAITPNLDRLMARSVVFTNAHCAAPVCSASRHALMSGLRPSTTGWYSNTSKRLADYQKTLNGTVPLPTHFKNNGYKTLAAGKIFHRGTSDVSGYDYWSETRPKFKWPQNLVARGHGYQGTKGGHFYPFPRDGGAIYQKFQSGVNGQSLCWGALEPDDIPKEGMPDEQIADWAVSRLKQQHDQPFLLAVGFVRPHVPYTAPKKYFEPYPLDRINVPRVPDDEMDDIPLHGKAMAFGTLPGGDHRNVLDLGQQYWKEMARAYLACVSFVDAQAGRVLDALEASPYADNTIVVLWSDHGQHLGEKRHWRKQALWEESTRVPLSFYLPDSDQAGKQCNRAASLLDVYPSLIELCSLPPAKGLEGTSLLPQLQDVTKRRTKPAVTTWHYNNHAVRGQRWRYIRYRDGSEELYNHQGDPGEHDNQAANPDFASIKNRLKKFLPRVNVMPQSIRDGKQDSHGRKVEMLKEQGIPRWLGQGTKIQN